MDDLYPLTPNDDVRQIKREDQEYYEHHADELVWVERNHEWYLQDPDDSEHPDDCVVYPTRPDDAALLSEQDRAEPSRGMKERK